MANLILGTMTFGQQAFDDEATVMLKTAMDNGIRDFDTAYVYNEGECERVIGRVLEKFEDKNYRIATKVNPRVTGKLDREAIFAQFNESLERLKMDSVDILYLHFPDHLVSLEEMLSSCNELYKQGKFNELGLSNYPADEVAKACEIAKENGWIVPTVYEGIYSALNRKVEEDLFAILRKYGMRFYAYNPLAGGLLTGKYKSIEDMPEDGRFVKRPGYKGRYWKESCFKAVDMIREACEKENISMVNASFRWLAYHSCIDFEKNDAILIGASRPSQLVQNIETFSSGPLPEALVKVYEEAWEICREDARDYFVYQN